MIIFKLTAYVLSFSWHYYHHHIVYIMLLNLNEQSNSRATTFGCVGIIKCNARVFRDLIIPTWLVYIILMFSIILRGAKMEFFVPAVIAGSWSVSWVTLVETTKLLCEISENCVICDLRMQMWEYGTCVCLLLYKLIVITKIIILENTV